MLCMRIGCCSLCPEDDEDTLIGKEAATRTLARRPDGKWPPGVNGNLYKPRRRRAALELIAAYTDGGRLLIERAHLLAGVPIPGSEEVWHGETIPASVQQRSLWRLIDFYFGKRISVSGKVTGSISHHVAPAPVSPIDYSQCTDEELAVLEAIKRRGVGALPAAKPSRDVDDGIEDAIIEAVERSEADDG
jgi:hypothetical protein